MDDLMTSLLVILITSLLVGGLFLWLAWRKKQQTAALLSFVQQRGWEMIPINERLVSGYRLEGVTESVSWQYESLKTTQDTPAAPGSSEVQTIQRWHSERIGLPNSLVAMGPKTPGSEINLNSSGMQSFIVQTALRMMLGDDAHLMNGLIQQPYGSAEFQAHYMIWAHHLEDVRRLLSSGVEQQMLGWKGNRAVLVKLKADGLDISLPRSASLTPADVEKLVELGVRLVQSWQRG